MRRKESLQRTITELRKLEREADEPEIKDAVRIMIGRLTRDIDLLEEELEEARMLGLRGPSFDGDFVGWLEDDFDDDDWKSGKVLAQPVTAEDIESLRTLVDTLVAQNAALMKQNETVIAYAKAFIRVAEQQIKK